MRLYRPALILLLVFLAVAPAGAQDLQPNTPEEIQARLTAAGDDPAVTEPTDEVIKTLRAAKAAALAALDSRSRAADFRGQTEAAPALMDQIRAELATPPEAVSASANPGATLAELERMLAQADADVKAARAELDSLNAEIPRRADRLKVIPTEIAGLQTEIDRLQLAIAAAPSVEVAPALVEARHIRQVAELDLAKARVTELQAEAASYDGRRDLVVLRRDRAKRRSDQAEVLFAGWQKLVADRRTRDAAEAAEQASQRDLDAASKIDALAPIGEQITELVAELRGDSAVPKRLANAVTDLNETRELLRKRIELEKDLRKRIASGGAAAYGPRLQSALRDLKDTPGYKRQLARYRRQTTDAEYRLQALTDLENESSDTGSRLGEVLEALGDQADANRDLAARLLEQRRSLVRQVQDTYETYADSLGQLDLVYFEYLKVSASLRGFVEEHVFWVRSVPRESTVPDRSDFAYDIAWLLDRQNWRSSSLAAARRLIPTVPPPSASAQFQRPVWHYLVLPLGAAVLVVLALVARLRLIARSRLPLLKSGRLQHMSMAGALWKLALALAAAAPLPLVMWILSAWLYSTADALSTSDKVPTPTPLAVASGLSRGAYVLLGITVLRELIRAGAVGATHFRWPEAGLAHLRRHLRWFAPVAVVAAAFIEIFNERTNDASPEVLGRLMLAAVLLAVAAAQYVIFSPQRPLIAEFIKKHRTGMIDKTAWLWYPLLVALPIVLAIATLAGFVYTALQIQRHVGDTFLFILVVIVGQALVLRSLQLARRRIAIEAARARVAAARQAGDPDAPREPEPAAAEVDLAVIDQQSRKVIQAVTLAVLILGLYGVWSEVLPALRWFERLQVLPTIKYIEPEIAVPADTAPAGAQPPATTAAPPADTPSNGAVTPGMPLMAPQTQAEPTDAGTPAIASVTVADIGLAILMLMLTVSASRNVPGLLEITLLPRLPIDAAARYAIFTIARYLVVILGIVAISRVLDIPWKNAQWLAAALTFGLAFGLQEIFANFVSGLIILFEQPIRVGDTVTVAGVNGTVAKIRMRATTVVDWDNKELVIPNKTFITDQIINWTLSDPICRVIIPVGITYGSDTELAQKLLLQVSRESPHTLNDPAARALFLGFGDNSLNFELRVFIDNLANLMATRSDLHFRIDREFRKANIEIAFPQRDLHLRSVDPAIVERVTGIAPRTTADGSS